jgi:hypothetical protein
MKRKLAGGVAAVSAGALPFLAGVRPAAADQFFNAIARYDHTFTNEAGASVTCRVIFFSTLQWPDLNGPLSADVGTNSGTGEACAARVVAGATYRDRAGVTRTPSVASLTGDVLLSVEDVGSHFTGHHLVTYDNCSAGCEVRFNSHPK